MRALAAEPLWRRGRFGVCKLVAIVLAMLSAAAAALAQSDPIKGSAELSAQRGFARLLLTLDDDTEPEITAAGQVLVVRFKRKADIALDGVAGAAPDYVGAVRRDPDGMAIRFALQRKVTLNAMSAGERTYIDLLPDTWSGPPPGLPAEVVRELAERARAAERALRQRNATAAKPRAQVRVRASQQPTFLRFAFDLPEGVTAVSAIAERKLTVSFDAPVTFDLTDARTVSSANITAIAPKPDAATSAIEVTLIGDSELRAFREEKSYVVDLVARGSDIAQQIERAAPKPPQPVAPPLSPVETESAKAGIMMPAGNLAQASSQAIAEILKRTAPVAAALAAKPVQEKPAPPAQATQRSETLQAKRGGDALRIQLPIPISVPLAMFRRADKIWLVMDSDKPIDTAVIQSAASEMIADAQMLQLDRAQAIRLRMKRPLLPSLIEGERGWIMSLADAASAPAQPLIALRNVSDPARASVTVALSGAGWVHRVVDPDDGETLQIVTARAPLRAMLRRQDFAEFALLETIHGIAVAPQVDDLSIDVMPERVVLRRPDGLMLSPSMTPGTRASAASRSLFDAQEWKENQLAAFSERRDALMSRLANAAAVDRVHARIDLARFYVARGFYAEAKGVLDGLLDGEAAKDDPIVLTLHALASTLAGHPALALADIVKLSADDSRDTQLWTAIAMARQSKWPQAREKFRNAGPAIGALPLDLQRAALELATLASLEAGDFADATSRLNEMELIGSPDEMKPSIAVLRGRVAQAIGRDDEALADFRFAASSGNRRAASEARLYEFALRQKRGEPVSDEMLRDLETLAVTWRGDAVEMKALQMLAKVYGAKGRFGEALAAARNATQLQPNSTIARQLQDEAAELFTQLYLDAKGEAVPPIEALATFYDYPELTPIGRRGDELIRRLADRLIAVDLLDQAGELLQHQVDHRLEGAARAQVAAKLATVYLMNRKPQRALAALQGSRLAELPSELRQERLLLEARAQSDIGRRELALDIISNLGGREAIRLRSDIYWAGRRWREAAEQIELYLGDRWRDFTPLTAIEKSDVLRAAIGYTLAEDALGQGRFREKFAPLMTSGSDRALLQSASQPGSANGSDMAQVVKLAASVDTLEGFVRDMKARFPETARAKAPAEAETTGSLPRIVSSIKAVR